MKRSLTQSSDSEAIRPLRTHALLTKACRSRNSDITRVRERERERGRGRTPDRVSMQTRRKESPTAHFLEAALPVRERERELTSPQSYFLRARSSPSKIASKPPTRNLQAPKPHKHLHGAQNAVRSSHSTPFAFVGPILFSPKDNPMPKRVSVSCTRICGSIEVLRTRLSSGARCRSRKMHRSLLDLGF